MSYNIDTIKVVAAQDFKIARDAFGPLRLRLRSDQLAEANVFDQLDPDPEDGRPDIGGEQRISFNGDAWTFRAGASFWWYGEWSGRCLDVLTGIVLPAFTGSADLVVCWEGGDSFLGLRVKDGKVAEHEVVQALGKEIKRRT